MNGQRSPRKGLSQNRAWPRAPPLPLRSQMANYPPSLNNDRKRTGVAEHPRPARRSLQAEWPLILARSEEHTSELQSQSNLVCRLLLEKKKKKTIYISVLHD